MRRDKIVAQIFLVFSIANTVLAAPAVVQLRGFEREGEPSDGPTPSLGPLAGSGSGHLHDYEASDGLSLMSSATPHSAASGASQLDDDPSSAPGSQKLKDFDANQYYSDQLSSSHFNPKTESSGGLLSATSHSPWLVALQLGDDPSPASESQHLNDLPHTSGSSPSQYDPTPESEAAKLHDPLPGSRDKPLKDNPHPSWRDFMNGHFFSRSFEWSREKDHVDTVSPGTLSPLV